MQQKQLSICSKISNYDKMLAHLKHPDKEKCHKPRKSHMNHGERYRKGKVEVFWRQYPLNTNKTKNHINKHCKGNTIHKEPIKECS